MTTKFFAEAEVIGRYGLDTYISVCKEALQFLHALLLLIRRAWRPTQRLRSVHRQLNIHATECHCQFKGGDTLYAVTSNPYFPVFFLG